ncbi:Abi family protein [Photorhabdus hainanensis]|nr:Abi family protein [Photorhabdus hainanensis]
MKKEKSNFVMAFFFENGLDIYRFDESLRNYIFRIISGLEIKFRSRLDHTISEYTDDPFWYLDDKNFFNKKEKKINLLRSKLSNSFTSCNEKYATHYKEKYYNEKNDNYKSLPLFRLLVN